MAGRRPRDAIAAPREPSIDPRYDLAGWYLVRAIARLKRTLPRDPPALVDLGMGRGRDIIYLAGRGFRVLGLELSDVGIRRAERRAARFSIPIRTQRADLRRVRLKGPFDVVYSSTALNHLPRALRPERFAHFRSVTRPGGIHAVNAFVRHPRAGSPPEPEMAGRPFASGELRRYYRDWEIVEAGEVPFDCLAGGRPHRHAVDVVIARRPT
jgi:tellurite methyltransferase